MKLADKHVVVTGGASGIGRSLCLRFATEGARAVVVADRDEEGAARVAVECGGEPFALDVSDEAGVRALVAQAEERSGPVDLFVSNAGIGIGGGVEVPDDEWQRIWDINVMAHVYAARALLPGILERGEGYLVSTASAAGLLTQIGSAPYAVTKHAAVALAEWLAVTYGERGLKVSVLCPQAVRTAMTAGGDGGAAGVDGMMEPEQVADCVVEALDEERFLILPHPEVEEYMQRKAGDYDRWLRGMQRLQKQFTG
ncbi:MAG: SDR family oxidoreductase [Deltaproteobacteria bacterium]|nr:SDR family oxidoreductase [Deltaproteobacteria bacterium]